MFPQYIFNKHIISGDFSKCSSVPKIHPGCQGFSDVFSHIKRQNSWEQIPLAFCLNEVLVHTLINLFSGPQAWLSFFMRNAVMIKSRYFSNYCATAYQFNISKIAIKK